jgi:predicted DCC family thiol-disulfide oxidoreductase YuxK
MKQTNKPEVLKVLYDGACPLCKREIAHVKGLSEKDQNSSLSFVDISQNSSETLCYAADREKLLARFHVEKSDGTRIDGAAAFVAMWDRLPGWRWLAKIAKLPGVLYLLEAAYKGFLIIRPRMQSFARHLDK